MSKNDGGPAYPTKGSLMFYFPEELRGELENIERTIERSYSGMTLRDWFAGQAMSGFIYTGVTGENRVVWCEEAATIAYMVADAMLAERSEP